MIPIAYSPSVTSHVTEALQVTWNDLSARLAQCHSGKKEGLGWMPVETEPGPRNTECVKSISLLVLDVEAKTEKIDGVKVVVGPEPPSPEAMCAEFELFTWHCILHTTHSHTSEHPRYRLVFDLSRPMMPNELKALGMHVAHLLGLSDCYDKGALEPARFFYLPRRPADSLELFIHKEVQGQALPVDDLLAEAQRITAVVMATPRRHGIRSGSVIDAYNAAYEPGELLEQAGYKPHGRNRWLYPGSTTGLPGVRVLSDSNPPRIYSSHAGDLLNDGHAHDAFDVFRILQHGGDVGAAVKAAAALMGMQDSHAGRSKAIRDISATRAPSLNGASEVKADDGVAILDAVHAFLKRFVAYPSEHSHVAHTLWIVHTHLMDAFDSTPRIAFLSPEPSSGKSRALEVTALIVPRPVESVNVTPAYLFRKVGSEDGRPTILYDEIDTVFGPKAKDNEEIRGLLNAGHRKHSTAGRCVVRGKQVFTEEIPAYCAVALAGLGGLPDTILSRSIVVRMRRRAPNEQIEPYRRREHGPEGARLVQCLANWALLVEPEITGAWPEFPHGIQDRDADVWEALLIVAEKAGGEWPKRARDASVALVNESKQSTPSLGILLLTDLRKVFEGAEALPTETILTKLIALDESPWGDLRGKSLDARGLSNRLKPYGVSRTTIRFGDETAKGYTKTSLADAWNRYLGSPPMGSVTTVTKVTPGSMPIADSEERGANVTDVTHVTHSWRAHSQVAIDENADYEVF